MIQSQQTLHYPLGEHEAETLRAASGRAFADISLEAAVAGELSADDLRIRAETLRAQAAIRAPGWVSTTGGKLGPCRRANRRAQ